MDCKKLSMDACMHAAQNERLPLRVVVQVNLPQYSSFMLGNFTYVLPFDVVGGYSESALYILNVCIWSLQEPFKIQ